MRDLQLMLRASETPIPEPSKIANPEPVSRARDHRRPLRQAKSSVKVSSGSRFYAHVVTSRHRAQAAEGGAQASHDEWLADARSRQHHPRRQQERRAQKMQSDY